VGGNPPTIFEGIMAKEKQTETTPETIHKVRFISSLYTFDFCFNSGDEAELTAEQYETAKKYNSIVGL
jgi:hypothetical protein